MRLLLPIAVKEAKMDARARVRGRIAHVRWSVSKRKCGTEKTYANPYDKRRTAAPIGSAYGA